MPATDATLVRGVLQGDHAAFAELYDRRARLIRAVCYDTTRDHGWAADLTQEVFLRAFRGMGRLRNPDRFVEWLTGIARQVCREWRRSRRREARRIGRLATPPEELPAGDSDHTEGDRIHRLRQAVAGLPERERLALHAFYLQEQDVAQARATLSLSRSGFYRLLMAARKRLERVLSKVEVKG